MSNIKLGVTTHSYVAEWVDDKATLEDMVRHIAELGCDGMEIVATSMFPEYPYVSDAYVGEIRRYAQDYGVKLLAVCPGATDTHFFDGFKTAASRLRMPEDVVRTTEKALKSGKSICTDGIFCKAQMLLSRIASRKSALGIMGKTGRKTWG